MKASAALWAQFITHLVEPRKKDLHVPKALRITRYQDPHQSTREKSRRLRQMEKAKLKLQGEPA